MMKIMVKTLFEMEIHSACGVQKDALLIASSLVTLL